jgi:K+-sensing histidine kinase KdpD
VGLTFLALTIGVLLEVDPKRVVRVIRGMRSAILPVAVVIFLLDRVTPAGIAVPVLYALPVLMASLTMSLEWSLLSAVVATALTYVGYYLSPPGANLDDATINRLIASVLIWACVLLGWLLRHVREEIQNFYNQSKRFE